MPEIQKPKSMGVALLLAFFLYPLSAGYLYLNEMKRAGIWAAIVWVSLILTVSTEVFGFFFIIVIGVFVTMFDCANIVSKQQKEYDEKITEQETKEKHKLKPVFEKFNKRYYTFDQKLEHLDDLTNLVNHKMGVEYSEEEIKDLLLYFENESNKEIILNRIKKLKNPTSASIANEIIQISPNTNFEESEESNSIMDLVCETLDQNSITYDRRDLKDEIISQYKSQKASEFEKKLSRDADKKLSVDEIEHLNGFEFEELIGDLFKKAGYKVKVTKKSGDQGADLIVEKDGVGTAIQTKKYAGSVGNKAVQEVVAAMKFYDCDKSMVITTGTFTKGAFELASRNGVQLIDKKDLDNLFDSIL